MPQDYAKKNHGQKARPKSRNSRHQPARNGAPGWIWLLAGVVVGMLVMAGKDMWKTPPSSDTHVGKPAVEQPAGNHKPRFDFYTLLRESEVIVPDDESTAGRDMPQAEDQYVYILQTGSFKNASDADSLRAQLLLLNLNASVETVEIHPGEKWHRVLVGPLENRAMLADARSKLADNGIDSLLLKRKKQ